MFFQHGFKKKNFLETLPTICLLSGRWLLFFIYKIPQYQSENTVLGKKLSFNLDGHHFLEDKFKKT